MDDQNVIYVCSEGRPWKRSGDTFVRIGLDDLTLDPVKPSRVRQGVWGAYGDAPIIYCGEDGGQTWGTAKGHPVKRKPFDAMNGF